MPISGITRGYQTISLVFDSNVGQMWVRLSLIYILKNLIAAIVED